MNVDETRVERGKIKECEYPSFAFKRQVFLNGLHVQTELARLFVLKPWIYVHFTFYTGFILSVLYIAGHRKNTCVGL